MGGGRLLWGVDSRRLRILCYHGVCEDSVAGSPWVPDYFVKRSAFERQLQYLRRNACVLPLSEAVARLRDGSLPPRSVSITFDDGYANNLLLAYPLLRQYQLSATVFLATAYIESGDMYPFLKLSLIRMSGQAGASDAPEYKHRPLDTVEEWAGRWWPSVQRGLSGVQRRTLRPLTVDEVRQCDPATLDFGAHTHTHCILKNETPQRREREIRGSLERVANWTGRQVRLFSYPNGERGDFSASDQQTLRDNQVAAAVTGIGGANGSRTELMELKRYPVGMYHDAGGFEAEVTGFRAAVLAAGKGLRA